MTKPLILLISLLLSAHISLAQSKPFDISGTLQDTLDLPLASATVLLLNPSDSNLIAFARSNEKGEFLFSKVKAQSYLLKATYIGCIPTVIKVSAQEGKIELGILHLKPIDTELFEVVIKTAKAPIVIHGDTIEYDATTFKVPPGSTVEDLLRRLPGVEVDMNGNIKAQGRNVNRVTVDGKTFFGDDPTMATKNLPSESISKVQVFGSDTEQSKLTGVKPVNGDKIMNLELKAAYKKGKFGRCTVGYGSSNRAELKGIYNRFNETLQFSALGAANNTNQNGLNGNDRQDFGGSMSSHYEEAFSFGFGNSNPANEEDGDNLSGLGSAFNLGVFNTGFPINGNGGISLNYDNKKTAFRTVLASDITGISTDANRAQQSLLPENTYYSNEQSHRSNLGGNHKFEVSMSQKLDSLTYLSASIKTNLRNRQSDVTGRFSYLREDSTLSNQSVLDNNIKSLSWSIKASAVLRKQFKRKGRGLGANATYWLSSNDNNATQTSNNTYYNAQAALDSISNLNQLLGVNSSRQLVKTNLFFGDRLPYGLRLESFYNFNYRYNKGTRQVDDVLNTIASPNDSLSRVYDNQFVLNRLGTTISYMLDKFNITAGLAFQYLQLEGQYQTRLDTNAQIKVSRHFSNFIPNISLSYNFNNSEAISTSYSISVMEPVLRELLPVIDNSNPRYIRVGNPNLIPEVSHGLNIGYNRNDIIKLSNLNISANILYINNRFTTAQTVDSLYTTTAQTINYGNGINANMNINGGFPIIKNKLSMRLGYNHSFNKSFTLVNDTKNSTLAQGYNPNLMLTITPNTYAYININADFGITDTRYNINTSQNQVAFNQSYSLGANARLLWKVYLNTTFRYSLYQNSRFGFNQSIPTWNLTLSKTFLKNDRADISVSIYDVFNRNQGILQSASINSFSQTRTSQLARYFMLRLAYNIKGIVKDVRRGS